jgi:branched-chain amino acid transport system substrate-binding protein
VVFGPLIDDAAVAKVTDPNGTPVSADTAGFSAAKDVLSAGGTVMFQGATGNVRFDKNGDVSAPAVVWSFSETGTEEVEYLSLADVDAFVASLK